MVRGVLLQTLLWAGDVTEFPILIPTLNLGSYRYATRWAFSVQGNTIYDCYM
jgi:hypothetical protein